MCVGGKKYGSKFIDMRKFGYKARGVTYITSSLDNKLAGSGGTWKVFAHEIAHNLGAGHPFSDSSQYGYSGGLMDYQCNSADCANNTYAKDIRIQGEWQFNSTTNKNKICSTLTNVISKNCKWINAYTPTCGNGIIETNEACECQDLSTSCTNCKDCAFAAANSVCSPDARGVHSQCCDNSGQFKEFATLCAFSTQVLGYCAQGICSPQHQQCKRLKVTLKYTFNGDPRNATSTDYVCKGPFHDCSWGCDLGDKYAVDNPFKSRCYDLTRVFKFNKATPGEYAGAVPNGNGCRYDNNGVKEWGKCQSGVCISPQDLANATALQAAQRAARPHSRCATKDRGMQACVFPFTFRNETYHKCTTVNWRGYPSGGGPWCSTTADFDKYKLWATCDEDCTIGKTPMPTTTTTKTTTTMTYNHDCTDMADPGYGGDSCPLLAVTFTIDGGKEPCTVPTFRKRCPVTCRACEECADVSPGITDTRSGFPISCFAFSSGVYGDVCQSNEKIYRHCLKSCKTGGCTPTTSTLTSTTTNESQYYLTTSSTATTNTIQYINVQFNLRSPHSKIALSLFHLPNTVRCPVCFWQVLCIFQAESVVAVGFCSCHIFFAVACRFAPGVVVVVCAWGEGGGVWGHFSGLLTLYCATVNHVL